jgi:hypothetical protein
VPHFMEMTQNTLKTWFPDFKDWFTPTIIIAVECAIFVLFIFMNIAFSLIYTKVLKLNYTDNWKMWCKVALIISIMFGAVIIFIAFLLYYFLSNDSKEKGNYSPRE